MEEALRAVWALICSGEGWIDVDDLIRCLERNGFPCPTDIAAEYE